MKIGLIGAPGSGKSEFAAALQNELGEAEVIDKYVENLADDTLLAYGFWADYIPNLHVAFRRHELEASAFYRYKTKPSFPIITCGTMIETCTYSFLKADQIIGSRNILTGLYERVETFMKFQGLFYSETWDYDFAFYLPLSEGDHEDKIIQLDKSIPLTIEAFMAPIYTLKGGTFDEKVNYAIKAIRTEWNSSFASPAQ